MKLPSLLMLAYWCDYCTWETLPCVTNHWQSYFLLPYKIAPAVILISAGAYKSLKLLCVYVCFAGNSQQMKSLPRSQTKKLFLTIMPCSVTCKCQLPFSFLKHQKHISHMSSLSNSQLFPLPPWAKIMCMTQNLKWMQKKASRIRSANYTLLFDSGEYWVGQMQAIKKL